MVAYSSSPEFLFGVTNGVACFQREMTDFVRKEGLTWVFPYLGDITICGKDQEEHDANLECFLEAAERKNITYNEEKSVFSTRRLAILGSIVEEGEILPDPERERESCRMSWQRLITKRRVSGREIGLSESSLSPTV